LIAAMLTAQFRPRTVIEYRRDAEIVQKTTMTLIGHASGAISCGGGGDGVLGRRAPGSGR
jgi:hypothetical protein